MRWRGAGTMAGVCAASSLACTCVDGEPLDIEDRLAALPGVVDVQEEPSEIPGWRYFLIAFDQPVDHADPEGQRFIQRLTLHHRGTASPFVLATTGYYLFVPDQLLTEPAALLGANQLFVEHRYFGASRPEPADWTLLDVEQAAADQHAISDAFHTLYPGRWISTGKSKGGTAAILHRRFHPADVDGTVAYVAPLTLGLADPRYVSFLEEVGAPECRKRIEDFQREVLIRSDAMIPRMAGQAAERGLAYDLIGVVPSFEGAVKSFPFSFWQSRGEASCDSIPGAAASDDEVWRFFDDVKATLLSTDPYVLGLEPYRWQARTELGTPGNDTTHLEDLLTVDFTDVDDLPSIDLAPVFDPAPMQDVAAWFAAEGDRTLFVYGQSDPWTAAAFSVSGAEDSYSFVVPGGNHSSIIADLPETDRQRALEALEAWTGTVPDSRALLPTR